jgi:hypothetical protein
MADTGATKPAKYRAMLVLGGLVLLGIASLVGERHAAPAGPEHAAAVGDLYSAAAYVLVAPLAVAFFLVTRRMRGTHR